MIIKSFMHNYRWGSPAIRATLGIGAAGVLVAMKPSARRGRKVGGSHENGRTLASRDEKRDKRIRKAKAADRARSRRVN